MQLQDSVATFKCALLTEGHTHYSAEVYTASLITHATMCRERVDLPPGAHRDFVAMASWITRKRREMSDIGYQEPATQRAACEALHDLIMEGV